MNCSPFSVLEQDTDEVIMIINYYIELADSGEIQADSGSSVKLHKEARIRVNDKTATGGWF